ncbi:MAG: murein biosynthesis integral membrane protein MurJ, partial [Pseudomonadales bacterium]
FFMAFRIPNFFRRLFAEGAFSQAFVPVLSEYRNHNSKEEVQDLLDKVAGTLGLTLFVIALLGVVGAELVISVFAAGYIYNGEAEKFALATDMLRLTFPYLLLISMTAFAGAILNTYGKFAAPAFTPVLLNLSLILCALLLSPRLEAPAMALAWGVLIAGVVQLTFQLPFLASEGLVPRPKLGFRDSGVARIMALMLPALFGVSVSQINLLVDTVLASFLQTGTLSWLYYSDRLLELPLALFGVAIATVILPGLSAEHVKNDQQGFADTLHWAMRMMLLFGLPASVALVVLSDELIATLFYQGEMTDKDVVMSGLALAAYGAGLVAHMYIKVLAPGF